MKTLSGILLAKESKEGKNGYKYVEILIQEEGTETTIVRVKPEIVANCEVGKPIELKGGWNRWDKEIKRFTREGITFYAIGLVIPEDKKKPV